LQVSVHLPSADTMMAIAAVVVSVGGLVFVFVVGPGPIG
jgi:hypothetical protein